MIAYIYNKVRKTKQTLFTSSLLILTCSFAASCSDWDEHYDSSSSETSSNMTLWEEIQQRSELSDFAEVLKNTNVFRQHKKTTANYAEFLAGGRSVTLFAPVNGTFNKDSLLNLVQTASGDSAVEHFFVFNHMTQNLYSTNGTEQRIRLLNNKYINFSDYGVGSAAFKESNIHAKNGIMHIMAGNMPYQYTVYELLANDSRFKSNGEFLASYNTDEFDEDASVSSGIVDGKKVYVDSVVNSRNKLMETIGLLNAEDSVYYVTVPTEEGWQKAWKKAMDSFVFPASNPKADSLQRYYAYRALMDDAIFSKTLQPNMQDSVRSKFYDTETPEYHVFYKPFNADGIFGKGEKINCSNGYVYASKEWPFEPTQTYHKKIETEAESTWLCTSYDKCTLKTINQYIDGVFFCTFVHFVPTTGSANWTATYKISNVISGKYRVKAIVLPKYFTGSESVRPCRFTATMNYTDAEGKEVAHKFVNPTPTAKKDSLIFNSDPLAVDTMTLGDIKFSACNYGQTSGQATLTLTCSIKASENLKYDRNLYLDAIILEPVKEEE